MSGGFASDIPPAVNSTAKKYIRGMKKGMHRWSRLYGTRAKEVMHKTANKMAMGEMSKMPPTYKEIFGEKWSQKYKRSIDCDNPKGFSQRAHCQGKEKVDEANKSGDSSLRDWFTKSRASDGTPGWVQLGGKYAGKPCAKQPGQTTKPKCGSSKMAAALNSDEEEAAFRRKNAEDPNPDRRGKAKNVATEEKDHEVSMAQSQLSSAEKNIKALRKKLGKKEKNIPAWMQAKITDTEHNMDAAAGYVTKEAAGEKDACYKKVKSRYKVWPSAYASGALVKCRKVGAANWGNKSEGITFQEFQEKALKCWKGCRRVPGTTPGAKGSCTCEDVVTEGDEMKGLTVKGGHKRSVKQGAGLTQKGVDAVNRKTGGNLKTAVTTPPSKLDPDSKAAKRRKSFCARSRSWTGERGKAARRRWNC